MRVGEYYWKEIFYRALGEFKKKFNRDASFLDDILFIDFLFKQPKSTKGNVLDEMWCYNIVLGFYSLYETIKDNQSVEFWELNQKDLLKSRIRSRDLIDNLDLKRFLNL